MVLDVYSVIGWTLADLYAMFSSFHSIFVVSTAQHSLSTLLSNDIVGNKSRVNEGVKVYFGHRGTD